MNINPISVSFGQMRPENCATKKYRDARNEQYGDTSPCNCDCEHCNLNMDPSAQYAQAEIAVKQQPKAAPTGSQIDPDSQYKSREQWYY